MENENLVTEVTENVEDLTTEELVNGATVGEETVNATENEVTTETPVAETFTKEQVDEMIAKKLARKEAKIRKEFEKKYGRLENVLKAGTGEEDLETMTDTFADFYTKKGIQIPSTPKYSDREMQILADAEANDIISSGYDEIVEEVDRLADIGVDNMTPQDKLIFSKLAKERTRLEEERELKSIGISKLEGEFKEFADKYPSLSLKEKYELYTQLNPKKKGEPIGSMKSGQMNKVKDYYSEDEISRLTLDDLNDPVVWEAVRKSMTGQN
jgi:hypothetical protein